MATTLAGDLTATGTNDSFSTGDVVATKWTAVASGDCDTLTIVNRAGSSFTSLKLGIYSHNSGTDRPNALLGSTTSTITDTSAGNKSLTLDTPVALVSGTVYWFAVLIAGGGWNTFDLIGGTGNGNHYNGYLISAFDATWAGTPGGFDDNSQGFPFLAEESTVLDILLPDADVTTTGWTSTPLFSKVNDSSDSTIITATAA